jgi:legumain
MYLESCESGAMFQNYTDDLNVYAVSSANASELAYANYCPQFNQDVVDGLSLGTCLGDLFSTSWMENSEFYGMNQSLME